MLALATSPSIVRACEVAGIARSTGQKYLKSVTFRQAWREYKSELMAQTTAQLQNASLEAVQVLRGIMLDDTASPYARQQAAQTVLSMAYKAHEVESVQEVLEEYEIKFSEMLDR
ncbi:hypothetical protein JavanS176_0002 [Streptococcus satellite phage Javan176]|nr:hypothetical protein JavanS176_0002 [Streptococcus satellite phage Javan176]